MTNKANLPASLRALCVKLALTQEQLADRLGVSFATRPDLIDRVIHADMPTILAEARRDAPRRITIGVRQPA